MIATDIRIYEPVTFEATPADQIDCMMQGLNDIAGIVHVIREYVINEAKISDEDADNLSAMLRGTLALIRDFGDCMVAVRDLAKAYQIAGGASLASASA